MLVDAKSRPVTRYIIGYKKEESDALLKFLYDHIAMSQDIQTRVRWTPGTVVVWDVSSSPSSSVFHPAEKNELIPITCRTVSLAIRHSMTGMMVNDAISPELPLRPRHHSRHHSKDSVNGYTGLQLRSFH